MELIIINVIEAVLIAWFISLLLDVREKKELYVFLLAFVSFSLITLSNYINMYDIMLSSIIIVCNTVISYWFVDNDLSEIIFVCCLESVFSVMVIIPVIIISQIIEFNRLDIISKVIYLLLGLALLWFIKRKPLLFNKKLYLILSFILFGLHFIMQQFIQIYFVLGIEIPELIISFFLIFICVLGLFFVIINMSQLYREKQTYEKLKQEKKNEVVLSQLYEEINIAKHDIKHIFNLLDYYMKQKEYLSVENLIKNKIGIVDSVSTLVQSNNKLINTILNNKIIDAYSKGIQVQCNIFVRNKVNIHDYDLNEMFSNILDNAIENCCTNGRIEVGIKQEDKIFSIIISNSIKEDFEISLTTKKNKKNHGFGLKSIMKIAHKYNGIMNTKVEDNCFYVEVILLLK